jgi:hypothetical protein
MSPNESSAQHAATDNRTNLIGAIVEIMHDSWDTPADCNDGELFTYAELLFDRIEAGEDRAALDIFLADVQTEKLGMAASDAHRAILDHALALVGAAR